MKPVAQRDLARLRPRCHALRDNRSLLRITPAAPPRRSRQNLHPTKTVPINWQITWHTIPLLDQNHCSRITPLPPFAARWGSGSAYAVRAAQQPVQRAEPGLSVFLDTTSLYFEGAVGLQPTGLSRARPAQGTPG